jgi:hypothetical protein
MSDTAGWLELYSESLSQCVCEEVVCEEKLRLHPRHGQRRKKATRSPVWDADPAVPIMSHLAFVAFSDARLRKQPPHRLP